MNDHFQQFVFLSQAILFSPLPPSPYGMDGGYSHQARHGSSPLSERQKRRTGKRANLSQFSFHLVALSSQTLFFPLPVIITSNTLVQSLHTYK